MQLVCGREKSKSPQDVPPKLHLPTSTISWLVYLPLKEGKIGSGK